MDQASDQDAYLEVASKGTDGGTSGTIRTVASEIKLSDQGNRKRGSAVSKNRVPDNVVIKNKASNQNSPTGIRSIK